MRLNPGDVRDFLARPRKPAEELKDEWWAARANAKGGVAPLEAGHALLAHAKALHPDFPGAEYRGADLAHHVHLKRLLDRASRAFSGR